MTPPASTAKIEAKPRSEDASLSTRARSRDELENEISSVCTGLTPPHRVLGVNLTLSNSCRTGKETNNKDKNEKQETEKKETEPRTKSPLYQVSPNSQLPHTLHN